MNKIWIANILLTRSCNLRCDYCNIVKNYSNMPNDYPLMKWHLKNEMHYNQWIDLITRLVTNNPQIFLIFYGGEPTNYKYLEQVLAFCNDNNVNYTVISNNTDQARKRIYEIYNKIGPFRGFTSSVDPVALMPDNELQGRAREFYDIVTKSRNGLQNLTVMKKDGIAHDVVAEITVMKQSLPYLYDTVKLLSDDDIYSDITAVDDQKTEYYDFSNVKSDSNTMLQPDSQTREVFDKLYEGSKNGHLKIHIPDILNKLYSWLPSNRKCTLIKDVHNVSIEPDGKFRLCLRIRGTNTTKLTYDQVINKDGVISEEFVNLLRQDYSRLCKGCNWTCISMSSDFCDKIIVH